MAQIYCYDPQSAGINMQSPQSDLTPWILTLITAVLTPNLMFSYTVELYFAAVLRQQMHY